MRTSTTAVACRRSSRPASPADPGHAPAPLDLAEIVLRRRGQAPGGGGDALATPPPGRGRRARRRQETEGTALEVGGRTCRSTCARPRPRADDEPRRPVRRAGRGGARCGLVQPVAYDQPADGGSRLRRHLPRRGPHPGLGDHRAAGVTDGDARSDDRLLGRPRPLRHPHPARPDPDQPRRLRGGGVDLRQPRAPRPRPGGGGAGRARSNEASRATAACCWSRPSPSAARRS